LPHASAVGGEPADVGSNVDHQPDVVGYQPVLDAFGGFEHGRADVDLAQVERHRAGIDRGGGGDGGGGRGEGGGRLGDVGQVLALLGVERAERRVVQQFGKPDDVGQRRAQLVGDVVDEIDLDPVGGLQRLVALAQRALDVDRVGDVREGGHGRAVGQRHGGAV